MSEFEIGGTSQFDPVQPPVQETQVVYVDRIVEKHKSTAGYWITIGILGFLFLVSMILILLMGIGAAELSEQNDALSDQVSNLEFAYKQAESDRQETEEALQSLTERIGSSFPLIINDIEIGNVHQNNELITDYGTTLYSSSAEYLRPKVKYYGIVDGSRTLKTKWFQPDGSIRTGSSSPAGFSQSMDVTIESGPNQSMELTGWGWSDPGTWEPGNYRLEVWYGNTCLKSKNFTVN
ncbi:MAG: hypothetical protein K2M07_03125 [Muribaculaceae bacterium]|nr:hypothetical protein [Muribaculaceae bacterium]